MTQFFVILGIFGVVSAFGLWKWWHSEAQVARRALRALQAVPIGELRPGQRVKVTGRVVLHRQALTSPLRQLRCAYWSVKVDERVSKTWQTVAEDWEGVPFWLEAPSGRVHLAPGGERLPLEPRTSGATGTFDDATREEWELLDRLGVSPTSVLGLNRMLRFEEASLDEGELVSVIGTVAVIEVDGEPALALVPGEEGLVMSDATDVHG